MINLLGNHNSNGVTRIESKGEIKFEALQRLGNTQKEILKEMLNGAYAYLHYRPAALVIGVLEVKHSAHLLLKDKTKKTVPSSAIRSLIERGLLNWDIGYKKLFLTERYRSAIELIVH